METKVLVKRPFLGGEVSQDSKNFFLSATEIVRAGNKWRLDNGKNEMFDLNQWLRQKGVKVFIEELENQFGKVKINSRGKGQHTMVHPYLALDLALSINPKFKVEVYKWFYDNLIQFRNSSGDSYKKMAGALYDRCDNKTKFKHLICDVALKIQKKCEVKDWNRATEAQLKLREKIQENIFVLSDVVRDTESLVTMAINKSSG